MYFFFVLALQIRNFRSTKYQILSPKLFNAFFKRKSYLEVSRKVFSITQGQENYTVSILATVFSSKHVRFSTSHIYMISYDFIQRVSDFCLSLYNSLAIYNYTMSIIQHRKRKKTAFDASIVVLLEGQSSPFAFAFGLFLWPLRGLYGQRVHYGKNTKHVHLPQSLSQKILTE